MAFQMLVVDDRDLLPEDFVPVTAVPDRPAPGMRPATGAAAIVARSMFAPVATQPPSSASQNPLGGYAIAGSIQIGRKIYAVVLDPQNRTFRASVGGMVGDWQLRAVTRTDVRLSRDGEGLTVGFGAAGVRGTVGTEAGSVQ